MKKHDVVVIGGGPAGAATATFLAAAGLKPIIVEKDRFPRYHIGESMTGECKPCLRKLGLDQHMLAECYPIKHGATVYGPNGKNSFWVDVKERRPPDYCQRPTWTWQVVRSKFDQALLDNALSHGVELLPCQAHAPLVEGDQVTGISYRSPSGKTEELKAEVVIDASGATTFLANRGLTSPKERGGYENQVAIFSQVAGAIRDPGEKSGSTIIFYREKNHWAWFIPISDDVVSVGVVTPSEYFRERRLSKQEFLRDEMQAMGAEMSKRVPPDVTFVEDVYACSNYSYHIRRFTGKGFLCVGDAHRFIDPIFAFGLYFAMKEGQLAAEAVQRYLAGEGRDAANPFASYETLVDRAQDIVQDLVDCFWEYPLAFLILVHHSHHEDMIDLFSGRIYDDDVQEQDALVRMRRLLTKRGTPRVPVAATMTAAA
jgi:1H-pyrrole-2-carbonyl-[peptidyl-carrier protein] brominase